MGSTTKSGRTRNRRAVAISAPPGGWPQLLTLCRQERTGPDTYVFILYGVNGALGSSPALIINGPVQWYERTQNDSGIAEVTYSDAGPSLTFTFDSTFEEEAEVTIFAWQDSIRGLNGEWLAPYTFLALPPP